MKIYCTICKTNKESDEFFKERIRLNGNGWCKQCKNASRRKRYIIIRERDSRRRKSKNPLQKQAQMAISKMIRKGEIKSRECFICGSKRFIEAHHPDYKKPFDIVWVCRVHHKKMGHKY